MQWTRLLVVAWSGDVADESRLEVWSNTMLTDGMQLEVPLFSVLASLILFLGLKGNLLKPFSGSLRSQWQVLVRQATLMLLKSTSKSPRLVDTMIILRSL